MIELLNIDCMKYMATLKDKEFDLNVHSKAGYKKSDWDEVRPTAEYFNEVKRVSKNQIIWGGNYFPELWNEPCKGFIFWNKLNHHDNRADGEMAWTSFDKLARYFEYMWDGNRYGYKGNIQGVGLPTIRIHPTEKPVNLYQFILENYAEKGQRILDTHLGSGNIAIACHYFGASLVGTEIDMDYYEKAKKNYQMNITQTVLTFSQF